MIMLELVQIPVLTDNYVYLIHEPDSGATAVIDPAVSAPVLAVLAARHWRLSHILCTHHHPDHVGGNLDLKSATGALVVGAARDRSRIPGLDIEVAEGDAVLIGEATAKVLETPGHTSAHICYWFADDTLLFCGDTVFSLGCGRLFEGTAHQMWDSFAKIKALPADTRLCCAHEYTQANGRFARSVDPGNDRLLRRLDEVDALVAQGRPTVPTTLELEMATNPFMRAADVHDFAERRRLKDHFV